jgi:hypothetical protein
MLDGNKNLAPISTFFEALRVPEDFGETLRF